MMAKSTQVPNNNWFRDPLPEKFQGQTIAVVGYDLGGGEPEGFWVADIDNCRAYYCGSKSMRYYTVDSPSAVISYILGACSAPRTKSKVAYFNFPEDSTRLRLSLLECHNTLLPTDFKKRMQARHFKVKGTSLMESDDDDLLAALDVDDEVSSNADPVAPAGDDVSQEDLPPHRRKNPPTTLRNVQEYAEALKGY